MITGPNGRRRGEGSGDDESAVTAGPDCERRRPVFPAEPANTVSSLSFLAGAALLVAHSRRRQGGDPASDGLAAAALAANGIGSAWYHARFGRLSRWSHDSAIAALLWLLAVGDAEPAARRRLEIAGLTGTAVTHALAPESTAVVHAVVAVSSAVAWFRVGRDDGIWSRTGPGAARHPPVTGRRRAPVVASALLAGAGCYVAGRPRSRWCHPDSLVQPHAAWHVLAAVASTALALDVADGRATAADRARHRP